MAFRVNAVNLRVAAGIAALGLAIMGDQHVGMDLARSPGSDRISAGDV